MFTLAVPNKGRLKRPSLTLLKKAGLIFESNSKRGLYTFSKDKKLCLMFLRAKDIPLYIHSGKVDLGITGYDLWQESGLKLVELSDLNFGKCKLVLAGEENSKELISGIRVGTSFPNLTANYFSKRGVAAEIIEVSGAVELLPKLGLADFIVDLTSTGRTLRENNLIVLDTVLNSSARLLCKRKRSKVVEFAKEVCKDDKNLQIE